MEYGICYHTFIPMRAEPSEKSEMISQILFGEYAEIMEQEKTGRYVRVKNLYDDYEGWCCTGELITTAESEIKQNVPGKVYVTRDILSILTAENSISRIYLGAGSTVRLSDKNKVTLNGMNYKIPDSFYQVQNRSKREDLLASAKKFISIPYLWGGRSSFGTDCSGFVQNIFKQAGIPLPRDAKQQAQCGKIVQSPEEALPGDLLFFHDEKGNIVHTGIYIGNSSVIHSSGRVRQDKMDKRGIINRETGRYSHNLASIRRVLDET